MKFIIARSFVLATLIAAGIGIAAGQELSWQSTTVIPAANGMQVQSTSSYRPHMLKQASENAATIFRLDKEMVYHVNFPKKEYSAMTFAEMQEMAKKTSKEMDEKMADMRKQMESMPPEQKKMMEGMMGSSLMGGNPGAKISIVKSSETKEISGYPCTKYSIKEDAKEVGTVWSTTKVPEFKTMQAEMKEFGRKIAAQMPKGGAALAAAFEKVDGFVIQSTIMGITNTVTKIEKKPVPVSEFEVPAGFKKVDEKDLMAQ